METRNVVGSYFPIDSPIHRIDPRLKFLGLILFIVMIFLFSGIAGYIYLTAALLIILVAAKLPLSTIWKIGKSLIIMFVILFLINVFITHPNIQGYSDWANSITDNYTRQFNTDQMKEIHDFISAQKGQSWVPWFQIPGIKIIVWDQSLWKSFYIIWRIFLMMLATFLLTSTTKPLDLTLALEDLLAPLKKVKVPVHPIAMMTSISLRFIPTVLEEATRIMKAQASRGSDFKNGNIKEKTKGLIALIIPLFVSAFQKAEDLANAMDARGYNPYAERTRFRQFRFRFVDYIYLLLWLGLFAVIIFTTIGISHHSSVFAPLDWFSTLGIGEVVF